MDAKHEQIINRFDEIESKLQDPAVFSDTGNYTKLVKEHSSLQPIVDSIKLVSSLEEELDAALAMRSENSSDPEMKALIEDEIDELEERLDRERDILREHLRPKDPNDDKNVIMEIRGGVGGDEAALFAAELYQMYQAYCSSQGYQCELIDIQETELGGIKEVTFMIRGQGAYSRLKYEAGGHRVQRVPVTESGGRIHTSAVTVVVMPEAEEVDVHIDPKDLRIDTYRASGAGGQHVNKTSSAIRITHLPTGLVVTCQDERSQHKNKDKAMTVLRSKLYEMQQEAIESSVANERKLQVGSGDRSSRIRTYNFPQDRVTDHRIGLSVFKIDEILSGSLDYLIAPLMEADRADQLGQGGSGEDD